MTETVKILPSLDNGTATIQVQSQLDGVLHSTSTVVPEDFTVLRAVQIARKRHYYGLADLLISSRSRALK